MSAIKTHTTPQTYSRLFRPWDITKTVDDNDKTKDNISTLQDTSKQLSTNTNNVHGLFASDMVTVPALDGITPAYLVDNYAENIYSAIPHTYNPYFPATSISPPPLFGVDPLTYSLMEQEYARVIAEDAQTKAINARKQRPKKFKCPHCDVAFSNNGQLKGHVRIHTGERPFKCDLESCGKTFTRNEELTRHKRIHTGIRPFACTVCGKKFGRRDHLKKHMKTHMPQDKQLGPAIFVPMYPYLYGC